MSGTDMQTAVTDMLAGLIQEGIADSGDYIDADTGLLMCGKCQSKKQTVVKLMGRTMKPSCLCRCKSEELEKEEQKRKNKELMEGIFRLKSAGLQDRTFFGYTFANCDEAHPCAGYAYRYVGHFAEFQKNGQELLFWGDVGTGKTFLAGCIANALMEKNIPVLMTSFPKLLNALGGLYSGEKNEYLKSLNQ